jgi:hypothetical protein
VAGFVAGVLSAPATARAFDSSLNGIESKLERVARSTEKIATALDALSKK